MTPAVSGARSSSDSRPGTKHLRQRRVRVVVRTTADTRPTSEYTPRKMRNVLRGRDFITGRRIA